MIDEARVLDALSVVRDPELDEPITDLGFVEAVDVQGKSVRVALRLPTYFCAPNFAFIMAADAYDAVGRLEDIDAVAVTLNDHFASREINDGLAHGHNFDETFAADAAGGLDELRNLFRGKAFIARQERLCKALLDAGVAEERLPGLTVGDLPGSPETELYLARRGELGIDTSRDAPFLVTPDGKAIPNDALKLHLRFARTVRTSIEGNASFCRGLLETRYGAKGKEGREREGSPTAQLG
jgi:metal-sulfur cluster biosynthetic enzyme